VQRYYICIDDLALFLNGFTRLPNLFCSEIDDNNRCVFVWSFDWYRSVQNKILLWYGKWAFSYTNLTLAWVL